MNYQRPLRKPKQALNQNPALALLDYTKRYTEKTDAFYAGTGAI